MNIPPYLQLMRLDKPIGTLLLLWPTLWALWLAAGGFPPKRVLLIFLLGVLVMRALGCVLNDLADQNFDGHVKRTCGRPLATGTLSKRQALTAAALLSLAALALALCLNRYSFLLASLAVGFVASYPFFKRFFPFPQLMLGVTFNFGVLMAYAELQRTLPPSALLLYAIACLWTFSYDTSYALVDKEDDLRLELHSSAITLGRFDLWGIALCQGLCVVGFALVGAIHHLTFIYYVSVVITALLFLYQQRRLLSREKSLCFRAFLNNQWVGLVIWLGIAASSLT